MTGTQEGYEKMSIATVIFLDANATVTLEMPEFDIYFGNIKDTNAKIQEEDIKQTVDTTGETVSKKEIRQKLISEVLEIVRRAVAYGNNFNDNSFLEKIDYKERDLRKASENKLVSEAQVVHDVVKANASALVAYGITAEMISALQSTINAFSDLIPRIRLDIVKKGETTQLLTTLFKTLIANWEKVDILVEMVRITNPEFYFEYHKLRKVIPSGTRHLSLKAKVVDAETTEAVANVKISLSITIDNVKKTIERRTASGGGNYFKSLVEGVYSISAEKLGFESFNSTVNIVSGEMKELVIRLKKTQGDISEI